MKRTIHIECWIHGLVQEEVPRESGSYKGGQSLPSMLPRLFIVAEAPNRRDDLAGLIPRKVVLGFQLLLGAIAHFTQPSRVLAGIPPGDGAWHKDADAWRDLLIDEQLEIGTMYA